MKKSDKVIFGGAVLAVIGIIVMFFGYDKFKTVNDALTVIGNGTPPGIAEFTAGILIAVVGVFTMIYGFGMLPEEPKMQERVTRGLETRPGYHN